MRTIENTEKPQELVFHRFMVSVVKVDPIPMLEHKVSISLHCSQPLELELIATQ